MGVAFGCVRGTCSVGRAAGTPAHAALLRVHGALWRVHGARSLGSVAGWRVHATISVVHALMSAAHAALPAAHAAVPVEPGQKNRAPQGPIVTTHPLGLPALPLPVVPGQAALPLLPSASLAARRRLAVDLPLKRVDKPARRALRPWLLPDTFSRP